VNLKIWKLQREEILSTSQQLKRKRNWDEKIGKIFARRWPSAEKLGAQLSIAGGEPGNQGGRKGIWDLTLILSEPKNGKRSENGRLKVGKSNGQNIETLGAKEHHPNQYTGSKSRRKLPDVHLDII